MFCGTAAPGGPALPIPPGATLSKAHERAHSCSVHFGSTGGGRGRAGRWRRECTKSKCRSVRSPRAVVMCSAAPGGPALPIPPWSHPLQGS